MSSDRDGIPDGWEVIHWWDPMNRTVDNDPEKDGISDWNEYDLEKFGAHPNRKDIFVEVDWMEWTEPSIIPRNPQKVEKTTKMRSEAIFYVVKAFSCHNIGLHIDDGCMGGGEAINHTNTLSESEFDNLYNKKYKSNEGFTQSRKGIFHYCIFADEIWTGRSGVTDPTEPYSVVADENSYVNHETMPQAGLFIHETGHRLGLTKSDFGGIDNDNSQYFWQSDYSKYANYKSCLNYRYTDSIIDYSDGSHGSNDYDDWGNIDLDERL